MEHSKLSKKMHHYNGLDLVFQKWIGDMDTPQSSFSFFYCRLPMSMAPKYFCVFLFCCECFVSASRNYQRIQAEEIHTFMLTKSKKFKANHFLGSYPWNNGATVEAFIFGCCCPRALI